LRVEGSGVRSQKSGVRVQGSGVRGQGLGLTVEQRVNAVVLNGREGSGSKIGFCVSGFGFHPGVDLKTNLKSISHRCRFEVAFVWELIKETIHLPLGCLQGGTVEEGVDAVVLNGREREGRVRHAPHRPALLVLTSQLPHKIVNLLF